MRRLFLLWFLLLVGFFAAPTLHAQGDAADPSDMFLNAYMSAQQGQKLEEDGKWTAALAKYRYAASLLDQVSERFADWQPLIVNYRKKKTSDDITRLQQKLESQTPALPTTPDVEPDLPTNDNQAANQGTTGGGAPGGPGGDVVDQAARQIRQQIQDLKNQLAQSQAQLAQAQQDKAVLGTRLRDALEKADRSQIAEQEAKSKLSETQEMLKTAVLDNSRNAAAAQQLTAEVSRLNSELQSTRDDRDAAEETNEDFQRRLSKANRLTDVVTVQRDAAYEKAKELDGRVATADQKLAAAQQQTAGSQEDQARLKSQLADLTKERDSARASGNAMTDQLDSAKKQIASLGTEREKLIKQRDEARNQFAKSEAAQARVDQLLADNSALTKKLATARKALEAGGGKNGADIISLRAEIADTKKDLTDAQQKNEQSETTIAGLQQQLDAKNAALANSPGTPVEKAQLAQENELLRGIVVREMKEQAHREQAKRLVSDELAKLQIQSDTLSQQLDYLGGPIVKLSPAERALFKQPELDLPDSGTASMSLSIAAPKPQATPESSAPVPSATGQPATDNTPRVETSVTPNVPPELVKTATDGRAAFESGQYRTAETAYEKILSKAPDNLYALSNLGVVRYRAGKYKMAEEALKKAIAIAPNDAFSYRTLGIVYYQQTQYDQAIDTLTKGLAINSKDAVAHSFLGIAASQKGWMEAAQKELETAVTIDPNYGDAHFNLAVVYATLRPPNVEKAQREYDRARALGIAADPQLEQLLKAAVPSAAASQ